jgi:thioredoxin 2
LVQHATSLDPAQSGDNGVVVIACPNCGKKNRVPAAAQGRPRCARCKQDLPWIVEAGEHDFTEVVERSPIPVVVDLWAPWCGPCHMISPALEEVARRRKGLVKLVKVNVDDHPGISARFGVRGIPTLLLLRDGQLVDRSVGARGTHELQAWIDEALDIAA